MCTKTCNLFEIEFHRSIHINYDPTVIESKHINQIFTVSGADLIVSNCNLISVLKRPARIGETFKSKAVQKERLTSFPSVGD